MGAGFWVEPTSKAMQLTHHNQCSVYTRIASNGLFARRVHVTSPCSAWRGTALHQHGLLDLDLCPDFESDPTQNPLLVRVRVWITDLGPNLQNVLRCIIVRSTYDSNLRRAKISLRNIVSQFSVTVAVVLHVEIQWIKLDALSPVAADAGQPEQHAVSGSVRPVLWSLLPSLRVRSSDAAGLCTREALHHRCSVCASQMSTAEQTNAVVHSAGLGEQWLCHVQRTSQV